MENFFIPLLIIHIVSGSVSLLSGFVNILRRKGDRAHKQFGQVFVIAMLVAAFSALLMSVLRENLFLFVIGFFTIYMIGTGVRYLKIKRRVIAKRVRWNDWTLSVLMFFFGLFLIFKGITMLIHSNLFGSVLTTFGLISILMVYQDIINLRGNSNFKNFGLLTHIQRMIGAYIASITAFLVVNIDFVPGAILWLLPTFLMVPLIIVWSNKFKILKSETTKRNKFPLDDLD
jgi:uncharacterized membrane protein